MRVLLHQPLLIYDVNRNLRELANGSPALIHGPLNDLNADDFTRTNYRALLDSFLHAITQDELEPLDYLRHTLQPSLLDELETLLADEWEDWQLRQQNAFNADLMVVRKQNERYVGTVDMSAELIDKVLRLRVQRLQRERQELVFLELDGDVVYQTHVMLSILAKRLIDTELSRRSQVLRQ